VRSATTQALAGSSVLGEVPPNRIDKLPVTLYRALQQQDMDQVRRLALNRAQARMFARAIRSKPRAGKPVCAQGCRSL
jgi:hypothetical protein